ncbi:MAG: methyltransferase domain-containing protein [Deltaproteobacteria bacterium]|nr:methyltransferase domain-containing protein [Deltaproteobacteria bacterium]
MKFTGERYIPNQGWASIAYEHLGRYLFAKKLAKDKVVLDLGSGAGYGSYELSKVSKSTVGIDIDPEAVEYASDLYKNKSSNLKYQHGSSLDLEFKDNTFDLVVCFEMLEHIAEHDELMSSIKRVLKDDGILLISTPNKLAYSDDQEFENEFHVKELYLEEFKDLMNKSFKAAKYFGQKNITGGLIKGLDDTAVESYELTRIHRKNENNEFEPVTPEVSDHMYYIAACSNDSEKISRINSFIVADRDERMAMESGENEYNKRAKLIEEITREQRFEQDIEKAGELTASLIKEIGDSQTPDIDILHPEQNLYDLILPNFNSRDVVKICIDSLIEFTDHKHRIFIVDDASTDPEVGPMLREYAEKWEHINYHLNSVNLGFPGTVNTGLGLSDRDVILINSDTEYSSGWLARMDRCRMSDNKIGTVTPLSNNATICSVPQINTKNLHPDGMSVSQMAGIVAKSSLRRYPRVATGVGYCMLVTRKMIDTVGQIDMAFGRGYAEEVDWCQRGWAAGFQSVLCDDAYVYHHGEVGHSEFKDMKALQQANEEKVGKRWPDYHKNVRIFTYINPLRYQHQRIFEAVRSFNKSKKPKLLQVVHSFDAVAGTEIHTKLVSNAVSNDFDTTVMYPKNMDEWVDGKVEQEDNYLKLQMNSAIIGIDRTFRGAPASITATMVEKFFREAVAGIGADIVHFQHLQNYGSLLLPIIAKSLGAKVVITLHDYFLLCPDWNMIYPDNKMCHKDKAEEGSDCYNCSVQKMNTLKIAKNFVYDEYINERNYLVKRSLESANVIIAPSSFVKEQFTRAHGEEIGSKILVIPHGTKKYDYKDLYKPAKNLRVAFLGNMTVAKGRTEFLKTVRELKNSKIEFTVVGNYTDGDDLKGLKNLKFYGSYKPKNLNNILQNFDAVIIGSIWNETYCYTVDESFRAGVPVISTNTGALPERVIHKKTGLVIPPSDYKALKNALLQLDNERDLLASMRQNIKESNLKDLKTNMSEYLAIYKELTKKSNPLNSHMTALMSKNRQNRVPQSIKLEDYLKTLETGKK